MQFYKTVIIEKLSLYGAFQNIEIASVAMLFNIMLLMIVEVQRIRDKQSGNQFSRILWRVLFANALTCLYVFLSYADLRIPHVALCVLESAVYMSNTAACYVFSDHVLRYFNREAHRDEKMPLLNTGIVAAEAVMLIVWLLFAVPYCLRTGELIAPAGIFFYIVAFFMEMYHVLFALFLIIRNRALLSARTQVTMVSAFLLGIATVAAQAVFGPAPVLNYLGATIGVFVYYFNAETPDYIRLTRTLEELTVERKLAEAANEAKSEFLANMSHEMRTPLSAVLGMNEMILRESRDKEITGYAKSIERAGQSLLAVINDVLDFSRIESGKLKIVNAPYSLSGVVVDVYNMMLFRAEQRKLELHVDVDPEIPDMLEGDEIRIRQVITNLTNNAIKYTREGSVSLRIEMESEYSTHITLIITVRDTGIGIRPEDMEKLFGKFERFDMEQNNSIEGSGLGLAITHEIVSMMGGEISAESSYGEGSTFVARIPQEVADPAPVGDFRLTARKAADGQKQYRVRFTAPQATILVVDDTDINLTVFRKLLDKTKMTTDTASGGLEALSLTQEIPYDLIFLDQRMPGMDGEKTLNHIRSQAGGVNKQTPVICLTADAVAGAREKYLAMGFTDYLQKPIDSEKLEETVMRYLPDEKVLPAEEEEEREEAPSGGQTKEETQEADSSGTERIPDEKTLRDVFEASGRFSYRTAIRNCVDATTLFLILQEFCDGIPENIRLLEQYADAGDTENYMIKAHALKGAARMVGALDFAEKAYRMEQAGEEGDADAIRNETPALTAELTAIGDALRPLMEDM